MIRCALTLAAAAACSLGLSLIAPAAPAAASAVPVQVTFSGSGTYTVDQTYTGGGGSCDSHDVVDLAWSATYQTTFVDGRLQDAPGSMAPGIGPGTMHFTIGGTCPYNNTVPPCTTNLGEGGGASGPGMSVAGTDPVQLRTQSLTQPITAAPCSPTDGAFIARDVSVLNASLPDSLTGVANIPAEKLGDGYSTSVGSGTAPGQVASSCLSTGIQVSANTACSASLVWSGTVSIRLRACPGPKIKSVTLLESGGGSHTLSASERQSYGIVDDSLHPGQTISTPDGVTLMIEFGDNHPGQDDSTIWTVNPNHDLEVASDCENTKAHPSGYPITLTSHANDFNGQPNSNYFQWGPNAFSDGVNWDLYSIEAHVAPPCNCSRGAKDAAVGSSSAPSFTLTELSKHEALIHVISGSGLTISLGGARPSTVAPGTSAVITSHGIQASNLWPASAQAVVPAAHRPPKLARMAVKRAAGGARVSFRLDAPAQVTVRLLRGRHLVLSRTYREGRGAHSIAVRKRLARGRYVVEVSAQRQGLVSTALEKLRIT
jgi:hypothetical protein